jgi:hypothetical protein
MEQMIFNYPKRYPLGSHSVLCLNRFDPKILKS